MLTLHIALHRSLYFKECTWVYEPLLHLKYGKSKQSHLKKRENSKNPFLLPEKLKTKCRVAPLTCPGPSFHSLTRQNDVGRNKSRLRNVFGWNLISWFNVPVIHLVLSCPAWHWGIFPFLKRKKSSTRKGQSALMARSPPSTGCRRAITFTCQCPPPTPVCNFSRFTILVLFRGSSCCSNYQGLFEYHTPLNWCLHCCRSTLPPTRLAGFACRQSVRIRGSTTHA